MPEESGVSHKSILRWWRTRKDKPGSVVSAVVKTRKFVLIGLVTGFGLLAGHELLGDCGGHISALLSKLLEHLGVGFLVAAVAVFFYEWGAHAKETERLNNQLASFREPTAAESLRNSIEFLFRRDLNNPPRYVQELAADCNNLVSMISELLKKRSWVNDVHATFLSSLLRRLVAGNALPFNRLSTLDPSNYVVDHELVLPRAAAILAGELLSEYMKILLPGDSYSEVSNLSFWQHNQLTEFQNESLNAASRGIEIKRVFDLTRNYGIAISTEEATNILRRHLSDQEGLSCSDGRCSYHVKIFGADELAKSMSGTIEKYLTHFAVLSHREERLRLKFQMPDLSLTQIARWRQEENESEKRLYETLFDEIWDAATDLSGDNLDNAVKQVAGK